ncbi:MAG TPA: NAD(+) diphosphatase [Kiloniellaceae bacterium]|nr:NAD(+) diphosphatase [Kiloniellaceae bacterium]
MSRGFPFSANFYSGAQLDRADQQRRDADWLSARLADPESHFLPLWRSRHLMAADMTPIRLGRAEATRLLAEGWQTVFLGLEGSRAVFGLGLPSRDGPERHPALQDRGEFRDLREVGPLLPREQGSLLAYARGLLHWHERHGFCGVCGSPTVSDQGGHMRRCTDEACGASHFPRTDPAVIMLVHDGADHCLLGRQAAWPPGMHSTLAGFVEPGESLEEAVAREVFEEVGVTLDLAGIRYHSSQPWPFPSSIMLGFWAACPRQEIRIDQDEIAEAAWYSREALLASPEDESFRLPRKDSIARRLVEDWLKTAP